MRRIIWFAAPFICCTLVHAGNADPTSPVADNAKADRAITLSGGTVAAGIGYTWGHGELKTSDRARKLSIKGVSVADVAATGSDATGNVCNLKSLADFSGNYVAAGAGVAVINGVAAVYLKNEHRVVARVVANTTGLKFNLSADGVRVTV
jgi:hypothetical protein